MTHAERNGTTPHGSLVAAWIRSWWATLAVLLDRDLRRQLREADRG